MPWLAPWGPLAVFPGCGEPDTHPFSSTPLCPFSPPARSDTFSADKFLASPVPFHPNTCFSNREPAQRALWRSLITS